MSNEPKPQDTPEEPKQEVKPTDELADEQLDEVNGGFTQIERPTFPQAPQISPNLISSSKH